MEPIKFETEKLNEYFKEELGKEEFTVEDIENMNSVFYNCVNGISGKDFQQLLELKINLNISNLNIGGYEFNNVNCEKLSFSNCNLQKAKFNENINVKKIDFSMGSKVDSEFLNTLNNIKTLNQLSVDFKNIEDIEIPKIDTLEKFSAINISDFNMIKNLVEIKELTVFNSKGDTYNLENLKKFTNLKELFISNVSEIEENLPDAKNLKVLTLNGCDLDNLDFVKKYKNLEYIDLNNNNLTDFKEIEELSNSVRIAGFDNNPIAEELKSQIIDIESQEVVENIKATLGIYNPGKEINNYDLFMSKHNKNCYNSELEIKDKESFINLVKTGIIENYKDINTYIFLEDMEGISKEDVELINQIPNAMIEVASFRGITEEKLEEMPNVKFLVEGDLLTSRYDEDRYYTKENMKDYLEIFETIKQSVPEGASELYKFLVTQKAIGMHVDYDESGCIGEEEYIEGNEKLTRSLEGLRQGRLVCVGYALASKYAYDYLGGEILQIGGIGKTETISGGHAWNKVKIEGKWYNSDLTWDYKRIRNKEPLQYTLKGDEEFSKDHLTENCSNLEYYDCPLDYPQEEINATLARIHTELDEYNQEKEEQNIEKQEDNISEEKSKQERKVSEKDLEEISKETVIEPEAVKKIKEMAIEQRANEQEIDK